MLGRRRRALRGTPGVVDPGRLGCVRGGADPLGRDGRRRRRGPGRSAGRREGPGCAAGGSPVGDLGVSMTVAGDTVRGDRVDRPAAASVGAHANRVSLDRRGLTEWYAAGPLGIEQGFTLARRPAGEGGPVMLALRLAGEVRARQASSGTVLLTRPGAAGAALRSALGDRRARAAAPRDASSARRQARDPVRDRGASYPLVIDPLIQQGPKLDGAMRRLDSFGSAWRCRRTGTPPWSAAPATTAGARRGCSPARAHLDAAGLEAHQRRRTARRSASAWRCRPTGTRP